MSACAGDSLPGAGQSWLQSATISSIRCGSFAITPDDQRFLMVRDNNWDDMAGARTVVVVENFFEELRAKLKK